MHADAFVLVLSAAVLVLVLEKIKIFGTIAYENAYAYEYEQNQLIYPNVNPIGENEC